MKCFLRLMRAGTVLGAAFAVLIGPAVPAAAQEAPEVTWFEREDGERVPISSLRQARSAFQLFGEGDRAFAGLRPTGNMEFFVTNTGIVDAADLNIDSQPDLQGCENCPTGQWFDVSPIYAAPRSEWERFIADVPSLANVSGGGYSVAFNFPTLGVRELLASDRTFGILFSGAQTTTDGGCQDFSAGGPGSNNAAAGLTLLALNNCPATWPDVGGTPTFLGASPISGDAWEATRDAQGSEFNWEWWTVDPALIDPVFFGNIHTYGAYDDYNSSMIGRFGNVVPGGSGDPDDEGWPMGLRTEFDAFTFAVPTVSNAMFWRATIINNSEEVYGVPLDYQNLYVGYTIMPIRNQNSTFYAEPWRGAILTAETNTSQDPNCGGVQVPGVGLTCPGTDTGFDDGSTAHIVLKSPIGDLRNVLFSCSTAEAGARAASRAIPCPTDEFNDPANVHAGDTITFNHFRMCPFGACTNQTVLSGSDRQLFGSIASNTEDVLNGRDAGTLAAADLYFVFRNPNFPQAPVPFAYWLPGTWDYSSNGETMGGDTLFVSTCYGHPGIGKTAREDACSVAWSDTMPRSAAPETFNPAYHNKEGNISHWATGPFALAAGDTTSLVIAVVAGTDSTDIELNVNNVIDLYMSFFLSPQAPPKVNIVGADAIVENPAEGTGNGEVHLFWDDASDDWVDPFLQDFAENQLAVGATPDLARINNMNPGLADALRARAENNVSRIMIFKSCDRGNTFTAADTDTRGDIDCDGDPTNNTEGASVDLGWEAYAILNADADGNLPNSFEDNSVIAGQEYVYVVVGQTRGARFAIVDSVDTTGDGVLDAVAPDSLVIAPSLINPLATSVTEPNVVSVYVPATIQAGGSAAAATFPVPDPARSTAPFDVRFARGDADEGRYRATFGNRFSVREARNPEGELLHSRVVIRRVERVQTGPMTAEEVSVRSSSAETPNPNGITVAADSILAQATVPGPADTTFVHTTYEGLGFVLIREATGEPLLVSTTLDGVQTTPPEFFNRVAAGDFTGFPGFVVDADNSDAGVFDEQVYVNAQGVDVPNQVTPTVVWDDDGSAAQQDGGVTAFGEYSMEWSGRAFGPGAPFRLNFPDPGVTQQEFEASLDAREVATTGRTDDAAAALLGVAPEDLVAVQVPFSIRNETFDRPVDVAMVSTSRSILLGNAGAGDTLSVTVPDDQWVPGDALVFVETVEVDSTVTIGGSPALVLDDNGDPIPVQREAVTFNPAILSCGEVPRPACNPVVGQGATLPAFITPAEGQSLVVDYVAPFADESRLVFDVTGAVSGEGALAADRDIRAQMDSIKAVPNPYVVFSEYQIATPQQNDDRLMFTHLPPSGTLRIFTVSGRFVQEISWGPGDLAGNGDLFWNLRTREGNALAAGLYVFVVTARNPATGDREKKIGKFVVIR